MAEKILASQIDGSTSGSWYTKLKTVQSKLGISQTTATVSAGTVATATTMNTFINRLNAVQSNKYGAYAAWSSYKPSTVSVGNKITQSTTYTKINNMLSSLQSICANNYTVLSGYTDDSNCGDYSEDATNSENGDCNTRSCDYCSDESAYDENGVSYGTFTDNSDWSDESDDSDIWGCADDRFGNDQNECDYTFDGCWDSTDNSVEGTSCGDDSTNSQDSQSEGCYNDAHCSEDVTSGNSTYGVVT